MPAFTTLPPGGPPRPYRFTAEEYHQLGKMGLFKGDDRVELLNGGILLMSPVGIRHAATIERLNAQLMKMERDRFSVRCQLPVRLDDLSEPQPDIALVSLHHGSWPRPHPQAAEIILVIEVADSTLRFDRGPKLRAYARSGVPEAWIINLVDGQVECYRDPVGDEYSAQQVFRGVERVECLAYPDVAFEAQALIPPTP